MKLATIGAVLTFALEREKDAIAFLDDILVQAPALAEELAAIRIAKAKHLKMIEQLRRENVTEMILEPIEGLDSDDYQLPAQLPAGATEPARKSFMAALEQGASCYLSNAAQKVKQSDIARILKKIAREKDALTDALVAGLEGTA